MPDAKYYKLGNTFSNYREQLENEVMLSASSASQSVVPKPAISPPSIPTELEIGVGKAHNLY